MKRIQGKEKMMRELSSPIIEDLKLKSEKIDKERTTVRAIITNRNEGLMLYSKHYDDYTFPGGGVEDGEDLIESLKRELIEEIGALEISNINLYGKIHELKHSYKLNSNNTYRQTSIYYKLDVTKFGEATPLEREIAQGIKAVWIDLEKALKHNKKVIGDEKHQKKGLKTTLLRENEVLKLLIEEVNNEKI